MGCHFSKFYLSDSDAYKNINSQLALINDPKDIFHYLRQKFKQDFECIFILGTATCFTFFLFHLFLFAVI